MEDEVKTLQEFWAQAAELNERIERITTRIGQPTGHDASLGEGSVTLGVGEMPDYTLQARVFGQLVKLAAGRMASYHSDLFHDASWLRNHLTTELVTNGIVRFWYAVDELGTAIGWWRPDVEPRGGSMWSVLVGVNDREEWRINLEMVERGGTDLEGGL